MTTPSSTKSAADAPAAPTPTASGAAAQSQLTSSQGRTQIADVVVSKIAALATREISGVHDLGGGAARAFGSIRERIPGASSNVSQGVAVEVGEKQAAVDLDVVVEYGAAIVDLAVAIRRNVITAIERMTGLEVVEVNIAVNDVHIPSADDYAPQQSTPARVE